MHKRKIINPNIAGLAGIGGLLVLGFLTITPEFTMERAAYATLCKGDNGYVECDASSTINTHARVAPVVSIGMQSDVVMDVVPKSTGVVVEEPVSVKVSTNSQEGYSLYMKALGDTNALTSTTPGNTSQISAVNGGEHGVDITTLASQGNVWGYSLGEVGSTNTKLYQAVPVAEDQPVRVTDSVLSEIDDLELTFALSVDTSLPSGTYNNSVLVSAVANPVTITNLNELVFMQDMTTDICANTAYDQNGSTDPATADTMNPVTKQLIDTRDGKKYWVAKLKDGKCWMVQNLALDLNSKTLPLTAATTNLAPGQTTWEPATETKIGGTPIGDGNANSTTSWNPGAWVNSDISTATNCPERPLTLGLQECTEYFTQINDGMNPTFIATDGKTISDDGTEYDAHYLVGNFYKANTATAGNSYTESGQAIVEQTVVGDICPKNWRLPAGFWANDADSLIERQKQTEYAKLFASYGYQFTEVTNDGRVFARFFNTGQPDPQSAPLYFIRQGYISDDKVQSPHYGGYYWTANLGAGANLSFYGMQFYDRDLYPGFSTARANSFGIRCIAR